MTAQGSQSSLGIQINTAESNSDADFNPNVESMVSDGCNLIIGVGFNLEKAIHTSADENKDVHYALIDSSFNDGNNNTVTLDNARPLLFNTAEAATWPVRGRGHDQDRQGRHLRWYPDPPR